MLSKLFSFHAPSAKEPAPKPDERTALGALMVRVAKSDRNYKFEEISAIDRLLGRFFGLKPIEAAKLRALCEKIEANAPATEEFAQIIRDHVDFQHRIEAHEALCEVMLADGSATVEELEIIARSRVALGLSEADCAAARDRVSA